MKTYRTTAFTCTQKIKPGWLNVYETDGVVRFGTLSTSQKEADRKADMVILTAHKILYRIRVTPR